MAWRRIRERWFTQNRLGMASCAVYIVVLLIATLTPLRFMFDWDRVARQFERALTFTISTRDAIDAVRNVVLFAGWGALWMVTSRRGTMTMHVIMATATGMVLSAGIETVQLFLPRRPSIMDLTNNTLGSLIGALGLGIMSLLATATRNRKSYFGVSAFLFAGSYWIATVGHAIFPLLRIQPLEGVGGGPIRRSIGAFEQFEWASITTIPLGDMVLYVPLGVFAYTALAELGLGGSRSLHWILLASVASFLGAELAHAPLGLPIEAGAVLTHVGTVVGAAWLWSRALPSFSRTRRGRDRPIALVWFYAGVMALWAWQPFSLETNLNVLTSQITWERLIPLRAYTWRMELFSVADVIGPFFLFLPLGGLLAAWPVQRKGWWKGCLPGIYLAVILEASQLVISRRFVDGTDALVQVAAVCVGFALLRNAGVQPHGQLWTPAGDVRRTMPPSVQTPPA